MIYRQAKQPKALWVALRPKLLRNGKPAPGYRCFSRKFIDRLNDAGYTCPVMAAFEKLSPEFQRALLVPWTGNRRSNRITETHHRFGRVRDLLVWDPGWMGVSKFGHRALHRFQEEARRHGWLPPVGWWNNERIMDPENRHLLTPIKYPRR